AQRRRDWPKSSRALSGALRRLAPNLRVAGIEVAFDKESGRNSRRIITIGGVRQTSDASDATHQFATQTDLRAPKAAQFASPPPVVASPSQRERSVETGIGDAGVAGVATFPNTNTEAPSPETSSAGYDPDLLRALTDPGAVDPGPADDEDRL